MPFVRSNDGLLLWENLSCSIPRDEYMHQQLDIVFNKTIRYPEEVYNRDTRSNIILAKTAGNKGHDCFRLPGI